MAQEETEIRSKDRWPQRIATCFGIGFATIAPGTLASLAALVLHWGLKQLPLPLHTTLLVLVTIVAIWSAERVCKARASEDPQVIVIDELVGALVALWLVTGIVTDMGLTAEIAAVALFRVLDIAKPWPIGMMERYGAAGIRVVTDDLVAGLMAGVAVALLWAL